jgi:hypothetical protein
MHKKKRTKLEKCIFYKKNKKINYFLIYFLCKLVKYYYMPKVEKSFNTGAGK